MNFSFRKYAVMFLIAAILLTAVPIAGYSMNIAGTPVAASVIDINNPGKLGSDVIITNGGNDNTYLLTWMSTSQNQEYVQWTETDKITNGYMPSDCYSSPATKEDTYHGISTTAQMSDLKADTSYTYRVGGVDGWSDLFEFRTNKDDHAFSFLLAGDPQIGASGSDDDYKNWVTTIEKAEEWFGDDIEFLLTAGDQVDGHEYARQHRGFAAPSWLRNHSLITTVGNHDNGNGYSIHYKYNNVDQDTLSKAGIYGGDFWVEYDGVLIMSLNVNNTSMSTHRAFMEKAIAEYTELHGEPLWTLVTFHFSIYTGGIRAGEFASWRSSLGVYMSELGVDAVLSGHDHVYTRAYMLNGTEVIDDKDLYTPVGNDIYGSYHNPKNGDIFYITANSSSGSKFYDLYDGKLPYAAVSNQENVPNITKIDVTEDSLVFTTYRTSAANEIGDVLDFFAIHRDAEKDKYAPSLNVPKEAYYSVGDEVDLYDGITAYDNKDGDLTDKIQIEGALDATQPVTLTYKVTDEAGNTASKQRTFIPLDTQTVISGENTVWKYLDDGTDPYGASDDRQSWRNLEFDDSAWKEGRSAFGSSNGELGNHDGIIPSTLLNQYYPEGSDDEGSNIPCAFFRCTFDVEDPERISMLKGSVYYNDACMIYINGVLVADFNTAVTSEGEITYNGNPAPGMATLGAISVEGESAIASLNLKEKDNIMAVMLYQSSSDTEDSIFFHFDNLTASANGKEFPFTDVKPTHWYYTPVVRAFDKGLFVGTSDTTFSPNGSMTRAMTWAVLSRIAGENIGASEGKWYLGYQEWAMANGVSDGTYPNNNVTREQLVSMLYRLSGEPETEGNIDSFADSNKVSDWAKEAIIWSVSEGLIVGRGDNLAPRDNATRAEASVLLLKYLEIK